MSDDVVLVSEIDETFHKFYDEAYGNILHNSNHLEWQFKNNPFFNGTTFSLIVSKNSEKITSHLGFIPIELTLQNNIIPAIWHVSFYTLEEFRGKKLGTKSIDLSNKFGDISMVLSGSEGTKKIYTNMNGKDLGLLHRYIRILSKVNLEKFGNTKINIQNTSIKKPVIGKIERITKLPVDYDIFWNNTKNRFPITVNRTKEYLTWRFFEHPIINYHFITFTIDESLQGFAVIRFEDNNEEIKAARLVDIVCEKTYDEVFLKHIIFYCYNKVDFIDFFCTGNFFDDGLTATGFFDDNEKEFKIPTVFNPIDFNRRQNINFFYTNNNENDFNIDLNDIDNWYLVKSDSDQDRAN